MQMRRRAALIARVPARSRYVFARTGTAEIATDPMAPNVSDTYIMLKPRERVAEPATLARTELVAAIEEALDAAARATYEFSSRSSCASTS